MKKLRLSSKKTAKRSFVNYTKMLYRTKEGVQKVFGTLDLFVSLLETEIKYPILQGGILPFWTPSSRESFQPYPFMNFVI